MLGEVRIYQAPLPIANCRTYIQLRFRTHIPLASLIRYRIGPLNSQPALSYRNSGRPQDLKHIPPGRETTYPREKQNPIAKLALPRGRNVKICPLGVAAGKTARKSPRTQEVAHLGRQNARRNSPRACRVLPIPPAGPDNAAECELPERPRPRPRPLPLHPRQ